MKIMEKLAVEWESECIQLTASYNNNKKSTEQKEEKKITIYYISLLLLDSSSSTGLMGVNVIK